VAVLLQKGEGQNGLLEAISLLEGILVIGFLEGGIVHRYYHAGPRDVVWLTVVTDCQWQQAAAHHIQCSKSN